MSRIDEAYIRKGAEKVTQADVERLVNKRREIETKARSSTILGGLIEDVRLMISLVKDYAEGAYREVPWNTLAAVVFTLLYVLSPVDLIPDFLPVVGLVDDSAVVMACLAAVRRDLRAYGDWKRLQGEATLDGEGLVATGRGDIHVSRRAVAELIRAAGRGHSAELQALAPDGNSTMAVRARVDLPVLGTVDAQVVLGVALDSAGRVSIEVQRVSAPFVARLFRACVASRIRQGLPASRGVEVGTGRRLVIIDVNALTGVSLPHLSGLALNADGLTFELGDAN